MSSPTINLNPLNSGDTSLLTISNLIRSLINDTQAGINGISGEGQIWTDSSTVSPFVQPFLNSAIRALYRELRNCGDPALIFDSVNIFGLTPINGANGLGNPDPATQVYISQGGYYDGQTINNLLALPSNVMYMEKLWERENGTNNSFTPMHQAQGGLPSRPQTPTLCEWEWRNNNINMVGSTGIRDVRMRYWGSLPTFFSPTLDFASTFVPIIDSTDALAYKAATMYARMLGSPGLADLAAEARQQMFELKNAVTKRAQSIEYHRQPYGHSSDGSESHFFLGWV